MPGALIDRFGRVAEDLRVSVTDKCNLRCRYCIPVEPAAWLAQPTLLSYEEMARVVRILVGLGVRSVRLTGGEPLMRRDVPVLVKLLAGIAELPDLALTTNGTRLVEEAAPLAAAGLRRVNVSLDTLKPERFAALTKRDLHGAVLAGIAAARAAGLGPLKINVVAMRGVNDDEFADFAAWARAEALEVRFIEFMPIEAGQGEWAMQKVVSGHEILERIDARFPLEPRTRPDDPAPAKVFGFRDGAPGGVGVITSVTDPFCAHCTRVRLTADGQFRTCLFSRGETDLRDPLRLGASDAEIAERIVAAVRAKGPGGCLEIHATGKAIPLTRTMHQIGG